jgi:hypothetical protein
MMKHAISMVVVLTLAGCGGGIGRRRSVRRRRRWTVRRWRWRALQPQQGAATSAAVAPGEETPRPEERPGEEARRHAETGDGLILGFAVASLGDASFPGCGWKRRWCPPKGRGASSDPDGRTVTVTLRPSGGGPGTGSRLSLQAMQALGVDLAALPTVTVISDA